MMAYHHGLLIWIEFSQPRRNIAHRDMSRAGKGRERDFERLANIEDQNPLAAIETCLKRYRIYFSDHRDAVWLTSLENNSTLEKFGSSVTEIENPKVSVCPGCSGSKCGFSPRMRCMLSSSAILSAL